MTISSATHKYKLTVKPNNCTVIFTDLHNSKTSSQKFAEYNTALNFINTNVRMDNK